MGGQIEGTVKYSRSAGQQGQQVSRSAGQQVSRSAGQQVSRLWVGGCCGKCFLVLTGTR